MATNQTMVRESHPPLFRLIPYLKKAEALAMKDISDLEHGQAPAKNIYYNSNHIKDVKTSVLYVNNRASMVTLDYEMDVSSIYGERQEQWVLVT